MVKFGKGGVKRASRGTDNAATVVGSAPNNRRRAMLIAGACAVLVVAVIVAVVVVKSREEPAVVSTIPNEEQAVVARIQSLENDKPAAGSSPRENSDYYTELSFFKAKNKDYQAAVDAFKAAEVADPGSLDYADYLRLASYYNATNDSANAKAALDKADALLAAMTPTETFDPSIIRENITLIRKEYGVN